MHSQVKFNKQKGKKKKSNYTLFPCIFSACCSSTMSTKKDLPNLFNFGTFFHVGIFILICTFLAESVSSIDPKYESCRPKNCGSGPDISFPFWIYGTGKEYCGYPGFEVGCEDRKPIFRTSQSHYIIQNISYTNQSFLLINEVIDDATSCLTPLQNFSFDRSSSFRFRPIHADLLFFYNCTNLVSVNCTKSMVACASNSTHHSFVALDTGEKNSNCTSLSCESLVAAPVELGERQINKTIDTLDYVKLLKNGFTLEWFGISCAECQTSGGFCGFDNGNSVCFCPDRPHPRHCKDGKSKSSLILAIVIPGVAGILLICVLIFLCRKKWKSASSNLISRNISSVPSSKSDLERGSVYFGVLPIFSYSELEEATNNFDSNEELGDGGFGTVYYGKLRDGREVAVKRLYENNCKRVEQFMNEVQILAVLRHKNLVSLYGCTSRHSRELLLVYEFIPNGTVADHLHGDQPKPGSLTWPIRMSIAIETATALAYLHASDIIHRDVKTNNILLDNNFCVKVADFGLSRLFPMDVTHVSTAPQGTPGYLDPDYHQCYQLTDKSDVYSFGVVLIELISSLPAVDISRHRHEINLADLAISKIQNCSFSELIDSSLGFERDLVVRRMATRVAELAFRCLQHDKDMRPSMDEVCDILKGIESENYEVEETEELENIDVGVLEKSTRSLPSPDFDDVGLLKNMQLLHSPNTVTEKWVSTSTTPNPSA